MDISKISEHKQPLLKRSLVTYRVATEGATPSRIQLVQSISTKEKGTVIVTNVYQLAGEPAAIVHCHVYSDNAVAALVERSNLIAKQQPKVEAAAEAQ